MKFAGVLAGAVLVLTGGCATPVTLVSSQTVTEAMATAPLEPKSPLRESATQRDVANYIIQLRRWGRTMKLQLDEIRELVTEEPK